jgi:dihydroneopterin aldolase
MDSISLRRIRAYGRHGCEPGERDRRQPIDIDVTMQLDLAPAQAHDDLARTLNYASLYERIVAIVATTSYALLERLAGDILGALFADPRVRRAEVTLSKPGILDGATPSVTLERSNPSYELP